VFFFHFPCTFVYFIFDIFLRLAFLLGEEYDPCYAPSLHKGLTNKNVQSTSFKLLQRALESNNNNLEADHEGSDVLVIHSNVKAPKIKGISDRNSKMDALLYFGGKELLVYFFFK